MYKLKMMKICFGKFVINIRYSSVIFRWLSKGRKWIVYVREQTRTAQNAESGSINVFIYAANCGIENVRCSYVQSQPLLRFYTD